MCFAFMRKRFPMLRLTRSDWQFDRAFAWQHLRLGLPMAVQFLIISMGILILQSVCNTFGPETIAGFVSATKIEQLALQPMISFGIAMAVYSAQNYGAGKYDRIRQASANVRWSLWPFVPPLPWPCTFSAATSSPCSRPFTMTCSWNRPSCI